jgi:tRNA U34 5-carboxymethylaminomethyl modifying enzyme MnmG/GidA
MAETKWSEYDFWLKNAAAKGRLKLQDEKKIEAARAQGWADTERFRQLANTQEEADKEGWRLNKAWVKDPANFDKIKAFKDKFHEADDLAWQIEEHEPFNMTQLMEASMLKWKLREAAKKRRR